ncbi:hypothetical protein [Hydrogenimonas sp. SS33]|uniref:hypothetical protein n=1 Tax=Hydrogenimonas leucolamina TaxID=2954236 RepID=UPI00336C0B8F
MLDLVLFGSIALLLLILIGFLIIVVRDHMKSKSFELYVRQTEEELEREHQNHEFQPPRKRVEPIKEERAPRRKRSAEPAGRGEASSAAVAESGKSVSAETTMPPGESAGRTCENQTAAQEKIPAKEERPTVYPFHPQAREEISEAQKEAQNILSKDFGHFSHQRLVEGMGLSPEEADEFVLELIGQLENAIAELDRKISEKDFESVEHITHGLKGAALNIGEGGVAQLLIDYNTYMKHGKELPVVEAYQTKLKESVSDLKVEYSQVA